MSSVETPALLPDRSIPHWLTRTQTDDRQKLDAQSRSSVQALVRAQPTQLCPPQSTAVSSLSLMPFAQWTCRQTACKQTPVVQSAVVLQPTHWAELSQTFPPFSVQGVPGFLKSGLH